MPDASATRRLLFYLTLLQKSSVEIEANRKAFRRKGEIAGIVATRRSCLRVGKSQRERVSANSLLYAEPYLRMSLVNKACDLREV